MADRWVCNRSAGRGGTCEEGPGPEGVCCHHYQCSPIRSLRARRGRFVFGCAIATLGGLCLMLSAAWRNAAIDPGPLSVQHAQLLQRGDDAPGCASCHAAADQPMRLWLEHATNEKLAQPSQSELCLECHQKQIAPKAALWAHNVDPQVLLANAESPVHRHLDPTQALACSTCHREHHGAGHDLTWMSDRACQACHQEQYQSFATDHPEFDHWPAGRRTRIAFDHGAHQLKHFPKEKQEFACATCHTLDRDGALQQTLGYEATCAQCHESKIEASWDQGIAMFALPMIDAESLRAAGRDVGQWPEQALGEFDGPLPPFTKLLLAADTRGAEAIETLGADFDFFDVDANDAKQLQAAGEVVWATKRLLYDLSVQGQTALGTRIETVLGRKLTKQEFSALTARLSPENVAVITERWLTRLSDEMASRGGEVPRLGNDLQETDRKAARQRVAAGGWFRDETTLSIRYRPTGHADPWLTGLGRCFSRSFDRSPCDDCQAVVEAGDGSDGCRAMRSCHSVDMLTDGRCVVRWFAKKAEDVGPSFTTFSHAPHLTQSELADCKTCHEINPQATSWPAIKEIRQKI